MRLRNTLAAASLFIAAAFNMGPGTATAADLPPPPPPPEIRESVHEWTGVYIGGQLGVACLMSYYVPSIGSDPNLNGCDWMGGVHAGYNHQLGNIVVGLEGDWSWSRELTYNPGPEDIGVTLDWISTLRGRVGWVSHESTLWYATAGVAWTEMTIDALVGPGSVPRSDTHTNIGYVVGLGVEHAFTSNFHARLEYLYADGFGTKTYDLDAGCGPPACTVAHHIKGIHMLRAGVSWSFNSWAAW